VSHTPKCQGCWGGTPGTQPPPEPSVQPDLPSSPGLRVITAWDFRLPTPRLRFGKGDQGSLPALADTAVLLEGAQDSFHQEEWTDRRVRDFFFFISAGLTKF